MKTAYKVGKYYWYPKRFFDNVVIWLIGIAFLVVWALASNSDFNSRF